MRNVYKIFVGKREGTRSPDDNRRRIISKWTLKKEDVKVFTGFIGSEQGPVAGFCEYGNESSGSVKGGEFPD
jgi:hypothetical protein